MKKKQSTLERLLTEQNKMLKRIDKHVKAIYKNQYIIMPRELPPYKGGIDCTICGKEWEGR